MVNGFGNTGPLWRGQRGRPQRADLPGTTAMQLAVERNAARAAAQFWSPARSIEVTQTVIQPNGAPVSVMGSMGAPGLSGLGAIGCREVEPLLQELKNIIDTSGSSLSAASLASAQAVYADINSYAFYVPYLGNDCSKHVNELNATIARLRAELGGGPPSIRPDASTQPPKEDMSPTAKFAIIGGITVAGIIGIAVITGQVAPLFRAVKRVF